MSKKVFGKIFERKLFEKLKKSEKFWIYHFPMYDRFTWSSQPGDFLILTSTNNILIEVKTTIKSYYVKGIIRKTQLEGLKEFNEKLPNNRSFILFVFRNPRKKMFLITLNKFLELKGKITPEILVKCSYNVKGTFHLARILELLEY